MKSIRQRLRGFPLLRRAYYKAREAWDGGPADPVSVRLIDEAAFRETVEHLVTPSFTNYVEFGVYNGTSLSIVHDILRAHKLNDVRLFGFDSFEGTPPDKQGLWMTGMCRCDLPSTLRLLNERNVDMSRVHLIEGWFEETLKPWRREQIGKASLIMVDSDLYQSAVEALVFVTPLIKDEAYLIFDDWNGFDAAKNNLGEKLAFDEWYAAHPQFKATRHSRTYSADAVIFHVEKRRHDL